MGKTKRKKTTKQLNKEGKILIAQGKFKKALEIYQGLWKKEPHKEWLAPLRLCYLARANALAANKKLNEAIALWEKGNALAGGSPYPVAHYIRWLIHTQHTTKAANFYIKHGSNIEKQANDTLLEVFAAAFILKADELTSLFPDDHPLNKQFKGIQLALEAYEKDTPEAMDQHLQSIPFRSPYRHFRQILKALSGLETDKPMALATLERIPTTSVFYNLAIMIKTKGDTNHELATNLLQNSESWLLKLSDAQKWDKQTTAALLTLYRLSQLQNPEKQFEFALRHHKKLGEAQTQKIGYALLSMLPQHIKSYEKEFEKLPIAEYYRLQALAYEQTDNAKKAFDAWKAYEVKLPDAPRGSETALRKATVLRHCAELAKPWACACGNCHQTDYITPLEKSMTHDPDDKETYLMLIKHYQNNKRKQQHWLVQALRHCPEEPDLLIPAIQAAHERKAYNKAIELSQSLLSIDPINPQAKQLRQQATLAYTQTLIRTKKYSQAQHHLAQADNDSPLIALNHSLLTLAKGEKKAAARQIKTWLATQGDTLTNRFLLFAEANQQGLPLNTLEKQLKLTPSKKLVCNDAAELNQVIAAIYDYGEQTHHDLSAPLEMLTTPFEKVAKLSFTREELHPLCERIHKIKQYKLLGLFAKTGLKRYPGKPLLVYYDVISTSQDTPGKVSRKDFQRLDKAYSKADETDDERAMEMLDNFLTRIEKSRLPPFMQGGHGERFLEMMEEMMPEFLDE